MNSVMIAACLTGFIGDFLLQTGTRIGLGGPTGWGLKEYFKQHGSAESLFVAAGMMSLFYALFIMSGIKMTLRNLAVYGVLLDLLFRKTMLFSSLEGYYEYFNYFWSAVWGAIPLMIPYLVAGSH
jgi:preprotein translocase subunit SecG